MPGPVIVSARMRAATLGYLHGKARDHVVRGVTHRQIGIAIDYSECYVGFALDALERDGLLRIEYGRHRAASYLLTPLSIATQ